MPTILEALQAALATAQVTEQEKWDAYKKLDEARTKLLREWSDARALVADLKQKIEVESLVAKRLEEAA